RRRHPAPCRPSAHEPGALRMTLPMKYLNGLLPVALLISASACSSSALQPPQGYYLAVVHDEGNAKHCAAPPKPFTGPMLFPSKYAGSDRSEEHTSELQSRENLVCRLL